MARSTLMMGKTLGLLLVSLACAGCKGAGVSVQRPLGLPFPSLHLSRSDAALERQVEKDPFPAAKKAGMRT
jgi:hypothetical protein